jgi:hypothetical protein
MMNRATILSITATGLLLCSLSGVAVADPGNQNNNGQHNGWDNGQHHGWDKKDGSVQPVGVPEPDTLLLFGTALAMGLLVGRRKRKK